MIVCLEGIDAAGKATQAARLAQNLNATHMTFPEYSTPSGELIHEHLQSEWCAQYRKGGSDAANHHLDAMAFQALMLTNRMEAATQIQAAKKHGHSLVLDRYWPSGVAYGSADGLDFQWLLDIHEHLPQPHLFVLVDIAPKLSIERRPERADRYELQPGLMEEVANNYHQLWAMMHGNHPSEWAVVDGNGSADDVEAAIWDRVIHGINTDRETE